MVDPLNSSTRRQRIDLRGLLLATQQRMIAELTGITQAVDHTGALGQETELAWKAFLSTILPSRYQVADGFVVDCDGFRSDQIDIIIFDRQYSPPLFTGANVEYVPAEAVYGVFEVKQRIDRKNLRLASDKVASVRALRRTSTVIPTADRVLDPKPLHRIAGGILALNNTYGEDFKDALTRTMGTMTEDQHIDIGCALNHSSFKVAYQNGNVQNIEIGHSSLSLVTFVFKLLETLQAIGTVPAIDYSEYSRLLSMEPLSQSGLQE